jgi:hypothetical protein
MVRKNGMTQAPSPRENRLVQLLYSSDATCLLIENEFADLLECARENNYNRDVSSMLIYDNGIFYQALEGPEKEIDRLFQAIKNDDRHQNVQMELYCYIPLREYDEGPLTFLHMQGHAFELPAARDAAKRIDGVLETMTEDVEFAGVTSWIR